MVDKKIQIEMRIGKDNEHILTVWKTSGYKRENVSDLLEIVGLIENFKQVVLQKINTKGRIEK